MGVSHRSWDCCLASSTSALLGLYHTAVDLPRSVLFKLGQLWCICTDLQASVALTSRVAAQFGPAQRAWVERVQKRVAVTAGLLGYMKVVKMLGLSAVVESLIAQLRKTELQTSVSFRRLLVWQVLLGE